MIFTEFRFLLFFFAGLAVHWSLRSNTARKGWLLACSYWFYAAWDWRFLSLIVGSTLVDYMVGRRLAVATEPVARKRWLLVSLVANLGLLGTFKYLDFFVAQGVTLSQALGLEVSESTLGIILPVGISFYTFQTLSYSIDIYRGRLQATKNLLDLALFVGFFPQLVAGPIVRAVDFLPQLGSARRWGWVKLRPCLMLFLVGYIKKAVVSDSIAPVVEAYFANPAAYDGWSSWLGVWLYAVQIYCDFSAYSDMAIASAGLLGYELVENFASPYFAASIRDFWRRWHISLSSWLRDYLYIPLGGSRSKASRNLMLTMLLGGLWHGAAWRFVVWGGMHGLALMVNRVWGKTVGENKVPALLGAAATFWWVCLAWIYFRAEDMDTAWTITKAYVFWDTPGEAVLGDRLGWVFAGLVVIHWIAYRRWFAGWWQRMPRLVFAGFYGVAAALLFTLTHPQAQPFVYFQF